MKAIDLILWANQNEMFWEMVRYEVRGIMIILIFEHCAREEVLAKERE